MKNLTTILNAIIFITLAVFGSNVVLGLLEKDSPWWSPMMFMFFLVWIYSKVKIKG